MQIYAVTLNVLQVLQLGVYFWVCDPLHLMLIYELANVKGEMVDLSRVYTKVYTSYIFLFV